jgi:hypothetical protein
MKRRMIIFAIIMLSIALAGLMVIQGYWIYNAYRLKQANFVRTVNESAHSVILTLEKIEMIRQLQEQDLSGAPSPEAHAGLDSINQVMLREMQRINTRKDLEVFFNKFFLTRELMEDRMFAMDQRMKGKLSISACWILSWSVNSTTGILKHTGNLPFITRFPTRFPSLTSLFTRKSCSIRNSVFILNYSPTTCTSIPISSCFIFPMRGNTC